MAENPHWPWLAISLLQDLGRMYPEFERKVAEELEEITRQADASNPRYAKYTRPENVISFSDRAARLRAARKSKVRRSL